MKLSSIALLALIVGVAGCSRSAPTLSSNQLDKESAAQQQFKKQLSGMTPEQMAAAFKSDPQRARAMLMPPGMGNPALRLNH